MIMGGAATGRTLTLRSATTRRGVTTGCAACPNGRKQHGETQMRGTRRTAIAVEAERRSTARRAMVGGRLREMRRRRGWSQGELGQRAGLDRDIVARVERGERRLNLEDLDLIAVAMGVALAVDFGRDPREDVADAGH